MPGPLTGVRVVALEQAVAAPLCSRILADLGADVVKVEKPGGDFARHWDTHAAGESAQFWWLNGGKRSIELDLKVDSDRRVFDRLLGVADVFVQNLTPAASDRLGLTKASVSTAHPMLIYCRISGYGRDGLLGDRKAYDMLIQAESGIMSLTGTAGQPMRAGVSVCDVATGIYAAALVLAGLQGRSRTAKGCCLDVSLFDVSLELVGPMLVSFLNSEVLYPRLPDRHHAIVPYGVFACRDGSAIVVAVEQEAEWRVFCEEVIHEPDLAVDARACNNAARVENREFVEAAVSAALCVMDASEAAESLARLGIAFGFVNDMKRVGEHPSLALGRITETEVTPGTTVRALRGLAGTVFGAVAASNVPPRLDEHRDQILQELSPGGSEACRGA